VQDGYQVGIIELADSQRWRIKDVLKKTTVYEIDLKDTKAILDSIFHFEPDVIFHLATYYAVKHHQIKTFKNKSPFLAKYAGVA